MKIKSKLKFLTPLGLAVFPFLASAQNAVQSGLSGSGFQSIFGSGGLNSSVSLTDLIGRVIEILLTFAGIIAVIFVIIGGYQYLTSSGNEEQAEQGRKTLVNAIIGVVVVILSYVIINVIVNLVSSNTGYGY